MSVLTSREIGNIGEEYTAAFLRENGCEILARNYCIRGGELDIVAKKGNLIHIVEVKTRKRGALSGGEEAITPKKISRVVKAARAYIDANGFEMSCVFDAAIVELEGSKVVKFEYIQRAFTA